MQPKIADNVSPELDIEHLRCCISTCCIRKYFINLSRFVKSKSNIFKRLTTI